jgi:hypothetical protein
MMKQIMKRAWEIYRTLVGDRIAKLSMALRQAWAEAKAVTTRAANAMDLKVVRAWVAHFFPTLSGLLESQIRNGTTVKMFADHAELEIGNIDVVANAGENHQMVLDFWYCGKPFAEIA